MAFVMLEFNCILAMAKKESNKAGSHNKRRMLGIYFSGLNQNYKFKIQLLKR